VAKKTKRAKVVSAFGTVPSDNDEAKNVVAQLIHDVGFEPVDTGPLRIARYLEPFTLAIAQLAYKGDEGPELAYRIERLGQ
jgi:predicted dinucleotide-binding enzyme